MDTADPALQSTDAVFQGCVGTSGDRGGRPGTHDGSSPLADSLTCCPCRPGVRIEEARAMANRYWNFPQICVNVVFQRAADPPPSRERRLSKGPLPPINGCAVCMPDDIDGTGS